MIGFNQRFFIQDFLNCTFAEKEGYKNTFYELSEQ